MHHKLFDRGVFTISRDLRFLVAEMAHGTKGFQEWLMRFHGKRIREPQKLQYQPGEKYINWHIKEVFKDPSRYIDRG